MNRNRRLNIGRAVSIYAIPENWCDTEASCAAVAAEIRDAAGAGLRLGRCNVGIGIGYGDECEPKPPAHKPRRLTGLGLERQKLLSALDREQLDKDPWFVENRRQAEASRQLQEWILRTKVKQARKEKRRARKEKRERAEFDRERALRATGWFANARSYPVMRGGRSRWLAYNEARL